MRRAGAQPDMCSSKTWADPLRKQEPYDTHAAARAWCAVPGSCRVRSSQRRPGTTPRGRWRSAKGSAPLASAEWSAGQQQQVLRKKERAQSRSLGKTCCSRHLARLTAVFHPPLTARDRNSLTKGAHLCFSTVLSTAHDPHKRDIAACETMWPFLKTTTRVTKGN